MAKRRKIYWVCANDELGRYCLPGEGFPTKEDALKEVPSCDEAYGVKSFVCIVYL